MNNEHAAIIATLTNLFPAQKNFIRAISFYQTVTVRPAVSYVWDTNQGSLTTAESVFGSVDFRDKGLLSVGESTFAVFSTENKTVYVELTGSINIEFPA